MNQNALIVSLPGALPHGSEIWLNILYAGPMPPQDLDREAINIAQDPQQEVVTLPPEPRYLYSNRGYWYPQSIVTDYATARMTVSVPEQYEVIATGRPAGPPAPAPGVAGEGQRPRRRFVVRERSPGSISRVRRVSPPRRRNAPHANRCRRLRASSCTSRPIPGRWHAGAARPTGPPTSSSSTPHWSAPPRTRRSRWGSPNMKRPAATALPTSPSSISRCRRVSPGVTIRSTSTTTRSSSSRTRLAHQWWGQAVGWKNYHEQWLSEGFAQYFAALYAETEPGARGDRARSCNACARPPSMSPTRDRSTLATGWATSRPTAAVFRSIVYNKSAMVLHMLRRWIGDEAFFAGVRTFYTRLAIQEGRHRRLDQGDGKGQQTRTWRRSSRPGSSARPFPT